jgi:hypothetical protein
MNTVLSQWRPKLPLTAWPPFAPRALAGGEGAGGMSDRLGERQESRFENLKVFEFDPRLLGGSAPKPPGFFEAWRRTSTYCLRTSAALQ